MSAEKPWVAMDLMSGEALEWFPTRIAALMAMVGKYKDRAIDVQYRPSAKKEWR